MVNNMAQSYEQLQNNYNALRTKHNDLVAIHKTINITCDALRAKQDAFNTTHDALLNKIIALRTERDELSAKLNEREQLIGELYGAIHTLQKTNPVSVENKRLSALLDASDRDNDRLRALYYDMNNALNTAKLVNFKLDKKCSDGITKLGAAREEIRLLNEEINENNNIMVNVVITKKPRITLDAR